VLEFLKREIGEQITPEAAAKVYTALFEHGAVPRGREPNRSR
jgi:hypothetical protein